MPGSDRSLEDVVRTREPFLRSILESPKRKRDLIDDVDASRSTVDRAIRDLADSGLIERGEDGYEATLAGRTTLCAVERYHRRLREVEGGVDVLGQVPADVSIPDRFLDGAEIRRASPEVPDDVIRRMLDSVESAAEVRSVTPVVLSGYFGRFYEAATANGTTVEMLIDRQVVERLLGSPETREQFLETLADERVERRSTDVQFPYGLWVTEAEAGVVLYSDTGVRGVIVNDAEDAIEWATTKFERLAEGAEPIEISD